ncbi:MULTISPECIES: winged helix-turn-helix transcriptional regulator [Nocardioides]|uniref:Winged helix-turn-helix transcriptional regulator n=1 Tax=Nocardioides vastitatis TaxID=2568655 RepID=A0ABW0ZMN8_9ACTN|nr:helix-turn-helix domain-containing protein [Nocardioides sp.]THJ16063.1 helix-turn-helix transcriptional regulator [Nocardioides sp.]
MSVQVAGVLAERGDRALGDRCPLERTLGLVGNRTALLLIREAFYGATRFDQLWQRVGVTEAVAAQRLRGLVAAGVLEKQPYQEPGQRTRHEYVLTPAGHDLTPVVLGLLQWGAIHAPDDGGVAMTHVGCGAEVRAAVRCAAGHDVAESEVLVATRK